MKKFDVSKLPVELQKTYKEMIMEVDTNIKLSDVILSDDNKKKITAFLREMDYKDKLHENGLEVMNRLLFYGASGTGKTFLAKALSNYMGYTMLYIDIAKALTEGNVAQNISAIFELANYVGDCVLFFDECDSIAYSREAAASDSGAVRRATNSIFQYLDQMNHSNVFIAATNMLHRLDAAFERRFNLKLEFRRPELNLDETIKHFMFPQFELIDDVDPYVREIVQKRTKQYVKLSYFELEGIVHRAMKNAVLNDTNKVRSADIYTLLAEDMNFKIKFGTDKDKEEIFHNEESYDPKLNKYVPKDYVY